MKRKGEESNQVGEVFRVREGILMDFVVFLFPPVLKP